MSDTPDILKAQITFTSGQLSLQWQVHYDVESGLTNASFSGHPISTLSWWGLQALLQSLRAFDKDLASLRKYLVSISDLKA